MLNLAFHIPGFIRERDWKMLYQLNRDGISMHTFLSHMGKCRYSVLIIEDSKGYKFGGFFAEHWKIWHTFYGSTDNFLFTFKNNEMKPTTFRWTGLNDQF